LTNQQGGNFAHRQNVPRGPEGDCFFRHAKQFLSCTGKENSRQLWKN
jgi:hypothetical protein